MRNHLSRDLETLNHEILKMAVVTEENIRLAFDAFLNRDSLRAKEALNRYYQSKIFEGNIDDKCAILLARQHPVARDLRQLIATIKISSDLERIGDLTSHLARNTLENHYPIPIECLENILQMIDVLLHMLRGAIDAFINEDEIKAKIIAEMDLQIDELRNTVYQKVVAEMEEKREQIRPLTRLLFLSRLIERMGDHTVSICGWTLYISTGKREIAT